MQARAVDAVREHDAASTAAHGDRRVWVAVSHGDVIKSVLADALGMHLDDFQRIVVDPASVSVVRYTPLRPFVLRVNDTGGDLACSGPATQARRRRPASATPSSAVGGGRRRRRRRPRRYGVGSGHATDSLRLRPAGALRRRDRRRARPRTFFLQARGGTRVTSVALEKEQVAVLAERVEELLDEVLRVSGGTAAVPAVAPVDAEDNDPLDARSRRSSGSAR